MKTSRLGNQGMTLVEILVVLVIIGLSIGALGLSISLAFSRDAERSAKVVDVALEQVRMDSMSKRGIHTLTINSATNSISITSDAGAVSEDLPGQIAVSFWSDSDTEITTTELQIQFDKSSGRVEIIRDVTNNTEYTGFLIRITCTSRSGKVATVVLISNTGKHYVEYV